MTTHRIVLAASMALSLSAIGIPQLSIAQESGGTAPQKKEASGHQGMQHRRGPKQFTFSNSEGATFTLWKPDLSTQPLEAEMGVITLKSTGVDNYHAIVAERDWGDQKEAIIRYVYMRGKPSGESPTRISGAIKTDFEIVPAPIPREHYEYLSNMDWAFQLRFRNTPVPNLPVVMETSNGSRIEAVSDNQGMITLHIPDDFPGIVEGNRDKREAEFSIAATFESGGVAYQTLLSGEYEVNPMHWKSRTLGVAAAVIGLFIGGFIGRVRKKEGSV